MFCIENSRKKYSALDWSISLRYDIQGFVEIKYSAESKIVNMSQLIKTKNLERSIEKLWHIICFPMLVKKKDLKNRKTVAVSNQ